MAAPISATTMNEQTEFPLFRLPPELRNRIYAYTLCQKEPEQKTTRLPAESPLEVVDLSDALTLRPSNKLLSTCRYIYAEAHGIFAAEQRAFWANNTFLIDMRDDWATATSDDDTEPTVDIPNLRPEYINLIPKVVLSVKSGSHHDEYHLTSRGQLAWRPEEAIFEESKSTTANDIPEETRLTRAYTNIWQVILKTVKKETLGHSYEAHMRVENYARLQARYVNTAAAGGISPSSSGT
jgi:hypothetical protein